jgi:hypothetical protein
MIKRLIVGILLAGALTGCAGMSGGGGPVAVVSDKSDTTGAHVYVMLPLGNESLDSGGMDYIAAQVAKLPGVTRVQIYDYYQTADAVAAINADPSIVKQIIIGFSCGANASPVVAAGTSRKTYVFVIQVSEWCGGTPLVSTVLRAQETYNPNCFDTGGLGCGRLVPGPGFNASNLTFIERPDCHVCSDHDPDAINDIVAAVKSVTSASAALRMRSVFGHPSSGPRILTRYHGQSPY